MVEFDSEEYGLSTYYEFTGTHPSDEAEELEKFNWKQSRPFKLDIHEVIPEIRISEQKDIERKSDKKDAIYYKYYARNSKPEFKNQRVYEKDHHNQNSRRNYHKSNKRNQNNNDRSEVLNKHEKHSRDSSNESKKGSELSSGEKRIRLRSRSRSVSNPKNINS